MNSKIHLQCTDTVLMIEPTHFGFNNETAISNSFQQKPLSDEEQLIQHNALTEFKQFVSSLENVGVEVFVYKDTLSPSTPDSIFPNNWISTHHTGALYTYPMLAKNRRLERREDIVSSLIKRYDFHHVDLSMWETELPPLILEGTGSMIFDRINHICYAALSPRTNKKALDRFSEIANYTIIPFEAFGIQNEAIYHTNVMLSVGVNFACIGTDTVSEKDRERVLESLKSMNKEILEFTNEQIYDHFAGNMLQLRNMKNETVLVLSEKIFNHLTEHQRNILEKYNDHLVPICIPTIEKIGGGSVRCMIAEIFKGP